MLNEIKEAITRRPRLYDAINRMRPVSGAVEEWLDSYSRPGLRFVQVGAADGLRWDPVRRFIVRDHWTGVLVEPVPPVFEMLKANYAYLSGLYFVNAAVGIESGPMTLWTIPDNALAKLPKRERMRLLRLSSFSPELIEGEGLGVQPSGVPCLKAADIISRHMNNDLDLLVSDAEGHDDGVLYGLDLAACRPTAILFETHNLGERKDRLFRWLEANNYSVAPFGGDARALDRMRAS
jgi:FkbM family methyltransferase